MPTKVIPAYTQQPVAQTDIQSLHFDRASGGFSLSVVYEVRDQLNAVQKVGVYRAVLASLAAFSGAGTLSSINTQEGT